MYLQLRNTTYHFRYVVPRELRPYIGKREVRQSLKTGNKADAQKQAIVLAGELLTRLHAEKSFTPIQAPATAEHLPAMRVLEILTTYLNEQRLQGVGEKTLRDKAAAINLMCKLIGNMPISAYSREYARGYRKKLLVRHAAHTSRPISSTTYNNHLKYVLAFWRWAIAEDYTAANPFDKLKIKTTQKASEGRKVYTEDDLRCLFDPTVYESDTTSYKYWLPLLALYTGARMNELCQLYLDDIVEIDGILCFHIRAGEPDQRIKNVSSERIIPIHSALVAKGLLERIGRLRAQGEQRLFPEISYHKINGFSHYPSRWFTSYRKRLGLSLKSGKDFHSFRHTVADLLKQQGVQESHIAALLGHASGGITYGRYGKDYMPEVMQPIVERISYSGCFGE